LREEKVARMVDREIAPVWHERFARLIWRHLPPISAGVALDVHAGSGRGTEELLERLGPEVRVLALEPSTALRTLARSRMRPEWKQRVYLKDGDMTHVAGMPDDAYDLVVANLVLSEAHDLGEALAGLLRVTKPGGSLLATLPLDGTWAEVEDLLQEVLRDAGLVDAMHRLRRMASLRPSGADVANVAVGLGIPRDHVLLVQDRFSLLFRSGREFLFSPLVELGPLRLWKAVIAKEGNPQEIFFRLKEAIDTYYAGHAFTVSAIAGLLHVTRPGEGVRAEAARTYWSRFPAIDRLFRTHERGEGAGAEDEVDIEIDIEETEGEPELERRGPSRPHPAVARARFSAEDEAILALLDKPSTEAQPSAELDALLDQVLEFDARSEVVEELGEEELEVVEPDARRPGETLKRIKALLPPPPIAPPPPPKTRQ
jgi:ubiquinone/menaquinone biosynthesis C-methylase UbiE